jgi:hypothetical protein
MAKETTAFVIPVDEAPISLEQCAQLLRPGLEIKKAVQYVREKTRPRNVNRIPCRNIGRCLIFFRSEVLNWVRNSPQRIHAPRKKRKAAKKVKVAA